MNTKRNGCLIFFAIIAMIFMLFVVATTIGARLAIRKYNKCDHSALLAACREMLSHGLLPGVVQVPHNGQPIVLMNDAQTTGGYPRIACIIEADMYQLAQIPLGQPIHFAPCSLEEALKARADQQRYLEQLAWRLSDEN